MAVLALEVQQSLCFIEHIFYKRKESTSKIIAEKFYGKEKKQIGEESWYFRFDNQGRPLWREEI